MSIVEVIVGAIVVAVVLSWFRALYLTHLAKRPPAERAEGTASETEEIAPLTRMAECPTCGTLEERRETVCSQCGATYVSEDLLAFRNWSFCWRKQMVGLSGCQPT